MAQLIVFVCNKNLWPNLLSKCDIFKTLGSTHVYQLCLNVALALKCIGEMVVFKVAKNLISVFLKCFKM
jgi:hypothetical protein